MSGKAVRETLAALGVIASMVFVGFEIQQNTAVARSQTRQALADASRAVNEARATNRDLARAWTVFRPDYTSTRDLGDLTFVDTLQARSAMFGFLRHVENVYLQVQEGVVDESVLNTYGFTARGFESPAFRQWWPTLGQLFDPLFVQAFEAANDLAP
jgi:hypothetical protein